MFSQSKCHKFTVGLTVEVKVLRQLLAIQSCQHTSHFLSAWTSSAALITSSAAWTAMASPSGSPPAIVRLFPRRKKDDVVSANFKGYRRNERSPHNLDLPTIAKLFCFVQNDAARELGISVTTLKQVCRKLSIERWPGPKRRHHAKAACQHDIADCRIETESNTCSPPQSPPSQTNPAADRLNGELLSRNCTPKVDRSIAYARTHPSEGLKTGTERIDLRDDEHDNPLQRWILFQPAVDSVIEASLEVSSSKSADVIANNMALPESECEGNARKLRPEESQVQDIHLQTPTESSSHDLEWLMTIYSEPLLSIMPRVRYGAVDRIGK